MRRSGVEVVVDSMSQSHVKGEEEGRGSAPYPKLSYWSSVLNWGWLNPPGVGLVSSEEGRNGVVSIFYSVI